MPLSLSVKKIKDHCLEFLSLSCIHFDIIMISLHFAREWKMIHKKENCWGRLRTMKLESQRRHLSCLWVDKYKLNFIYKNVRYCLMFIVSSILFYFFLDLVLLSSSSRTPVMWCIGLWSYMSSPTGVMWNILVFTASVCMDRSPPNETNWWLTHLIRNNIYNAAIQLIYQSVKHEFSLVVWGWFRANSLECIHTSLPYLLSGLLIFFIGNF